MKEKEDRSGKSMKGKGKRKIRTSEIRPRERDSGGGIEKGGMKKIGREVWEEYEREGKGEIRKS